MNTTDVKTPQPVVNTQLVAQVVALVLSALVGLGLISTDISDQVGPLASGFIIGAIPVVAAVLAAYKSRGKVTTLANPRDENLEPLQSTEALRQTAEASYKAGRESVQADPALVELALKALEENKA